MLTRIFRRTFASSIVPHRVNSFTCHHDMIKFMDTEKPVLSCLFFGASWNPKSSEAEEHFRNLSNKFLGYTFAQLDCEKSPIGKRYYGVRCEPEFVVCAYGTEIARQTGTSKEAVEKLLKRSQEFIQSVEFATGTNKYEPFHSKALTIQNEVQEDWDQWTR